MLKDKNIEFKIISRHGLDKRTEWINDPDIQKTLNYDTPISREMTNKWFENIFYDFSRKDFEIYDYKTKKYIGFCGVINIKYPEKKAEVYVTIGEKEYWGKGYGTEAYKLLSRYCFEQKGLNKIYAYYNTDNLASQRIFNKLGWKNEGLLRKDIFSHGKLIDRYLFSKLSEEYKLDDN